MLAKPALAAYNPLPMRPLTCLGAALVALFALATPVFALESAWSRLPPGIPADSLAPPLRLS